jgi:hypothetical protein
MNYFEGLCLPSPLAHAVKNIKRFGVILVHRPGKGNLERLLPVIALRRVLVQNSSWAWLISRRFLLWRNHFDIVIECTAFGYHFLPVQARELCFFELCAQPSCRFAFRPLRIEPPRYGWYRANRIISNCPVRGIYLLLQIPRFLSADCLLCLGFGNCCLDWNLRGGG